MEGSGDHGLNSVGEGDAQALVRKVAGGDREAFQTFYERYGPRVMAVIRRRVTEGRLAQELVQDVFVAAWLAAPGYRPDVGDPQSWLLGITRHKLLDHWRSMRRIAAAAGLLSHPSGAAASIPDADLRLTVEQAIASLTVEQRQVVDLIYQHGLTFAETARALNIPAGTVKSRVNAALTTMRGVLIGSKAS